MADFDLSKPSGRFRTYLDYLWNDHAYLRLGFSNAHWISDELVRAVLTVGRDAASPLAGLRAAPERAGPSLP